MSTRVNTYNDLNDIYMKRAINVSRKASVCNTLPNPRVGAVLVKNNTIISTGYHKKYGHLHAEGMALENVSIQETKGATLYCTLEPCQGSWKGKHQEACVNKIIRHKISKVYIASEDPNPKVSGKGIDFLRKNGVEVSVLSKFTLDVQKLNEIFFVLQKKKRPFLHLKIAQSLDSYMANEKGISSWKTQDNIKNKVIGITCENSRKLVHAMRANAHAICCGVNTIITDNPLYSVRYKTRASSLKSPALVIFDSRLRTPLNAKVFSVERMRPNIIIFTTNAGASKTTKIKSLEKKGAQIIVLNESRKANKLLKSRVSLSVAIKKLYEMEMYSLFIESGATLSNAFLSENLVDKLSVFTAPALLGSQNNIHRFYFNQTNKQNSITRLYYPQTQIVKNSYDVCTQGYLYDVFKK